jgi:hypothetical protein
MSASRALARFEETSAYAAASWSGVGGKELQKPAPWSEGPRSWRERTPREWEGLMVKTAVRRWDVVGVWSLEVKIVVHQSRRVGVLGRSCEGMLGRCSG